MKNYKFIFVFQLAIFFIPILSNGQKKVFYGIGARSQVVNFIGNPDNSIQSPLMGITGHVDVRLYPRLFAKLSAELGVQWIGYSKNVVSASQLTIPLLISHNVLKSDKLVFQVEGGVFFTHFLNSVDVDYNIDNENIFKAKSTDLIQNKYYLNYGSRLGLNLKKKTKSNNELNFQIHYARSIRNSYSIHAEYKTFSAENGIKESTLRYITDLSLNGIYLGIYYLYSKEKN